MNDDANEDFSYIRNSFCIYPFLELNITASGLVKPCCVFSHDIERGGRTMSVNEYSLAEIWNSDAMRNIRRLMVEGKPVDGCNYCYKQIKQKFRTIWEDANDAFEAGWLNPRNETLADLKRRAISSDFALPNGPERLDMHVGSLCNLRCRTCHFSYSSSVAADPVQVRWPNSFPGSISPASTARWRGSETVVAPRRVLGVSYDGLSEIDWSNSEPVAWTNGHAQINMNTDGIDLVGIALTIDENRPVDQRLRLTVNSHVLYDDVPAPGLWSRTFNLNDVSLGNPALDISINSSFLSPDNATNTGLGIRRLALIRASKGRNLISIGRFASGRQWFQNKEFIETDLFYDLQVITKLNFIGGEPLLIKEVRNIMRYLISMGRASDITLSVSTNGTVMDDEWRELAVRFKLLIIQVSLDGYSGLNDYLRYPSEWESIKQNLKNLQNTPNAYVYVKMAVQAYNMLHVTELIDFCEREGLDFHYQPVVEPPQLNCNGMPDEIRSIAAEKLRRYAMRNQEDLDRPNQFVDYRKNILALAETLEMPSTVDIASTVREFMIYTNDLDQSRQQKFSDVGSELITMLEERGYPWINENSFCKVCGFRLQWRRPRDGNLKWAHAAVRPQRVDLLPSAQCVFAREQGRKAPLPGLTANSVAH